MIPPIEKLSYENGKKIGYRSGFKSGYKRVESEFKITSMTVVYAGKPIVIKTNSNSRSTVKEFLNDNGWGHTSCLS